MRTVEYLVDKQGNGELIATRMKLKNGTTTGPVCVKNWQCVGWKGNLKLGDKVIEYHDNSYYSEVQKVTVNGECVFLKGRDKTLRELILSRSTSISGWERSR